MQRTVPANTDTAPPRNDEGQVDVPHVPRPGEPEYPVRRQDALQIQRIGKGLGPGLNALLDRLQDPPDRPAPKLVDPRLADKPPGRT